MTNQEFAQFADKLFIAFPSLHEWMEATYKPQDTQRLWRSTLSEFTLAECISVLERWTSGELAPFEAYERDKVHLIVRAICAADRDRILKRELQAKIRSPYAAKRGNGGAGVGLGSLLDSSMKEAVLEGAAEHRRLLSGEIDSRQYESLREVIMARHGI